MNSLCLRLRFDLALAVLALASLVISCGGDSKSKTEVKSFEPFAGLVSNPSGDIATQATSYRDSLAKDPKNTTALFNLVAVEVKNGPNPGAETYYRQAIAANPSFAPNYFVLAFLRSTAGDKTEAIELLRKAIDADNTFGQAYLNLGYLLVQDGQSAEGNLLIAMATQMNAVTPSGPTAKP